MPFVPTDLPGGLPRFPWRVGSLTEGDPKLEPDWILADLHLCDGRYVRI